MLPGNATLTVQSRPFVGWKMAVGLVVSTSAGAGVDGIGAAFASDRRFRFLAFVSPRPIIAKLLLKSFDLRSLQNIRPWRAEFGGVQKLVPG